MLQITDTAMISTTMEGILYGFSVLMYILTFWILYNNDSKRYPKYVLVAITVTLFILTTAEMITNIVRLFQGFLDVSLTREQSAAYFSSVSEPTFVIKSCLFNAQTLLLDGVVIYRTWVVWQKDIRIVLLPIAGWLGLLSCSIVNNIVLATAPPSISSDVFATTTGRWITAVYSMTLVTNISATGLLAYRIWTVNRSTTAWRTTDRLSPVLRVVVESGALYSFTIIAAIITFALQSPGVYVLLDMISPIISIVYNMIIIRVGIASGRIFNPSNGAGSAVPDATSPSIVFSGTNDRQPQRESVAPGQFRLGWLRETVGGRGMGTHEMKPLAVEIRQYRETDIELDKYGARMSLVDDETVKGDTSGRIEKGELVRDVKSERDRVMNAA